MAIYEYKCSECGSNFEVFQKIGDPHKPTCSQCGGADVSRLISSTSFILKGKGWYSTDYKSQPCRGSDCSPCKGTTVEPSSCPAQSSCSGNCPLGDSTNG